MNFQFILVEKKESLEPESCDKLSSSFPKLVDSDSGWRREDPGRPFSRGLHEETVDDGGGSGREDPGRLFSR